MYRIQRRWLFGSPPWQWAYPDFGFLSRPKKRIHELTRPGSYIVRLRHLPYMECPATERGRITTNHAGVFVYVKLERHNRPPVSGRTSGESSRSDVSLSQCRLTSSTLPVDKLAPGYYARFVRNVLSFQKRVKFRCQLRSIHSCQNPAIL